MVDLAMKKLRFNWEMQRVANFKFIQRVTERSNSGLFSIYQRFNLRLDGVSLFLIGWERPRVSTNLKTWQSDMKLNIDGITEIDDFYFTPRCDMMQIYIRDKNGFQGPYCDNTGRVEAESFGKKESDITRLMSRSKRSINGQERSNRVRRAVKSMEELKETGFQGDEIDLVFVKDHNSYRFTFGFEFTWELLNTEVSLWYWFPCQITII